MNIAWTAFARVSLLLCGGFAGGALAQSNTQTNSDSQCVRSRCFQPSCYRQSTDGYYLRCPDGIHFTKPEQTGPTEGDRKSEQTAPKESQQTHPSDPVAMQAVGGDWEIRMGASPKPLAILRLRPGASGSLEGTIEQSLGAPAARVSLQDVTISGSTLTYATPNGKQFRGTLSSDHQTIVGDPGSPTWSRARPLAQAPTEEATSR